MTDSQPKIVAVTGTKGKTSLVRLLEHVARSLDQHSLRVDTTGAYYDAQLEVSDEDSRRIWGYASTNAPGRFLALHPKDTDIALLECTLFCAFTHLGYKAHDIGVFTNVFEDHLGALPSIKSKADIARMKSFVFKQIKADGYAIYNADDPQVLKQLHKAPVTATKIGVGLSDSQAGGQDGYNISYSSGQIVITKQGRAVKTIATDSWNWLDSRSPAQLYLALFAVAVLFSLYDRQAGKFEQSLSSLARYQFDPEGGRMVSVKLKNGATVILDYAHEKVSLKSIADYARGLASNGGQVIGVLRLAPSRTKSLVKDTAQYIYSGFDQFVIYDKVDGVLRQPAKIKGFGDQHEVVGKMAALFSKALKETGEKPVFKVISEDQAIAKAVKLSCSGDIIVYIVGDDSARSRQFLTEAER